MSIIASTSGYHSLHSALSLLYGKAIAGHSHACRFHGLAQLHMIHNADNQGDDTIAKWLLIINNYITCTGWHITTRLFPFASCFCLKISITIVLLLGIISEWHVSRQCPANIIVISPNLQLKTKYKPGLLSECATQLVEIGQLFLLKSSKICAMLMIDLGVIMVCEIDIFICTRLPALECTFNSCCN